PQKPASHAAETDHTLITATRALDTAILTHEGERIGKLRDLSIEKLSGQVRYALISFGGFLGVGDRVHPVPWNVLTYEPSLGGYVTPLDKAALEAAPNFSTDELAAFGGGDKGFRDALFAYYGPYGAAPYWI